MTTETRPPAEYLATNSLVELPLDQIETSTLNPRTHFDADALAELAESIRAHGVLQPIVVRPAGDGRYSIVAGERRFRASGLAGLTTIPAVLRQDLSDDRAALEVALVENLQPRRR